MGSRRLPDVVLAEFEDAKTSPLGYRVGDLASLLEERGYSVYVSEWHPVLRYGSAHDWRCLRRFDGDDDLSATWGNLIGFREDPGERLLEELAVRGVKFGVRQPATPATLQEVSQQARPATQGASQPAAEPAGGRVASAAPPRPRRRSRPVSGRFGGWIRRRMRPWSVMLGRSRRAFAARRLHARGWLYHELAKGVRDASEGAFRTGQALAWAVRGARRHPLLAAFLAAAIVGSALFPFIPGMWQWRVVLWPVAGACLAAAALWAMVVIGHEALRRYIRQHKRFLVDQQRDILQRIDRTEGAYAEVVAEQAEMLNMKIVEAVWSIMPEVRRQIGLESSSVRLSVESLEHSQRQLRASMDALSNSAGHSLDRVPILEKASSSASRSAYGNREGYTAQDRRLHPEDLGRIQREWLPRFKLSCDDRQLMYLAHDIYRGEDWSEGHLATTIQAAVLRSLALASLGPRKIELLEIGTLFGVGAGALYRSGVRIGQSVGLTLIAPFGGYRDVDSRDFTTEASRSLEILVRNLRAMSVPESDVRMLVGKSDEDQILAAASDRVYDYVLINGDQSEERVSTNFARYGELVRPGGLLVFDDYDTPEFPQIKSFVDTHVRNHPNWRWVGEDWRTAIVARRD